jgi:catechol 2,3-dioxygenase-like lactoylglutathione lyase family enzyme
MTAEVGAITGGLVTVFVADMDRSTKFYTESLGLKLVFRAGDHWAQIDGGHGLAIGLHPSGPQEEEPGTRGSLQIGLNVTDIVAACEALRQRGVSFDGEIVNDEKGGIKLAFFKDPDGNVLYLCESKW